jgi:hypothetical protein
MLGLYSREELTKDDVTDLIRREFLARLFEDESKRTDSYETEFSRNVIWHLMKIRSILCPSSRTMMFSEAEALFHKTYCEAYLKITDVEAPEDNGWWPDCLEKADNAYTKSILQHLATLNAQYDVQWQRQMMQYIKKHQTAGPIVAETKEQ